MSNRFWAKVDIKAPNECWAWTAAKNSKTGYGCFRVGSLKDGSRRMIDAHRHAVELTRGFITEGLYVLHRCDNRICVNPNHLYVGTQSDNISDMWNRGRSGRKADFAMGKNNGRARLSEDQVRMVRASLKSGPDLAKELGITRAQVSAIRRRKAWAHVA